MTRRARRSNTDPDYLNRNTGKKVAPAREWRHWRKAITAARSTSLREARRRCPESAQSTISSDSSGTPIHNRNDPTREISTCEPIGTRDDRPLTSVHENSYANIEILVFNQVSWGDTKKPKRHRDSNLCRRIVEGEEQGPRQEY